MRFKKGQSGNPKGKPRGAKDKRTELRALFEPHRAKLIRKVVALALKDDTTALKICIDRLVAPIRPRDAPIHFGPLKDTLVQKGEQVFHALSRGELSPDEASSVMQTLTAQARIVEVDDLERRVATLEQILKRDAHATH